MIEAFRSLFAPPRHLILVVAAVWVGLAFAEKRTERHGVSSEQLNNLVFYSIFGYLAGGRLLFALSHFSAFASSPLSIFSPNPDLFDPTAALLSAIIVGLIFGRRQKLDLQNTLDSLTPLLAMVTVGLSLSHLAAGTGFGSPTSLPWAIELWGASRHPSQVYELIASLLILGWVQFHGYNSPPGADFVVFIALTAGAHVFLGAFRGDSELILGGIRLGQIEAWLILLAAFFASERLYNGARNPKNKKPASR